MWKRIVNGFVFFVGYILSPFSWWNDLLINVPIAYVFSFPFVLINENLFLPTFILGYWFSNLLGFVMMHMGAQRFMGKKPDMKLKKQVMWALLYTSAMGVLIIIGFVPNPVEFLH